jgi:hypothetical protein
MLRCCYLLLLCSTWPGLVSAAPAVHYAAADGVSAESQDWPAWQEYAMYLVSQRLCEAVQDEESNCLPVTGGGAAIESTAATQAPQYPEHAFENSGWYDTPLLVRTNLSSNDLQTETQLAAGNAQDEPVSAADPPEPKSGLSAESVMEDAIPGSLLVTILALVGIVAVARRDIPGKDTVESANSEAGVASVTYLRHSTEKLHQ